MAGFIVEGPLAGGHNAPPRGQMQFSDDGQPLYGARDAIDLETIRKLGLPFWLAGGYGSPERRAEALAQGAAGIQVGTPFALCLESGLAPEFRRELVAKALAGQARVYTDPLASPTGFPFKVADLAGSLSDPACYAKRARVCDLGFLREAYRRPDGSLGYRCAAEPEKSYLAKGGEARGLVGRKCLCNGLVANIGMAQCLPDGTVEPPLITLGDDYLNIGRFCANGPEFSAADVIRHILG
jgi:nitronate monooxygenase